MTSRARTQSGRLSAASHRQRNFILQQGLCEPAPGSCALQFSALRFQPWLVGFSVVIATVVQAPHLFFVLALVLWWSALAPSLNPFDALYNWTLARRTGALLKSAPAPRRFAQFLAGSFALAIGVSLALGLRMVALMLEGFLILALGALLFGGFCLGSFIFHLLRGRAEFARRTLPWSTGL